MGALKMTDPLGDIRREEIWYVLSGTFVDNEVDYDDIAGQVADVDIDQLKEIFFAEVAPYCGPNLMDAIPIVWSGFSRKPLCDGIKEKLEQPRHSWIAWIRYKGFVAFCRCYFMGTWKSIKNALDKRK